MKRRFVAVLATALALSACAGGGRGGPPGSHRGPPLRPVANPGKVIATELGFARAAQDRGQWTAFAEYATKDAVMFVPEAVNAQAWLKGRSNPAQSVMWQPHQVWSSCDGSLAMTKGAWQRPDGSVGYFTTVWQRQGREDEYLWVMDQGDVLEQPLPAPEMASATVASCEKLQDITAPAISVPTPGTTLHTGEAEDRTLRWIVRVDPDGGRYVAMEYWNGTRFERPFAESVAAPAE